jgi:hypothetical protein
MKKQNVFTGMMLFGLGLYFVMKELPFINEPYIQWPLLLIIVGISLYGQAYKASDLSLLFSASTLVLLGLHFYGLALLEQWPNHWAMFPLIISISFFVLFYKTKTGVFPGILFLLVAIIGFFYHNGNGSSDLFLYILNHYWSALFLIIGLFYIIKKKAY